MSNWRLNNHIRGKVYDLTQDNMNAMISDIETLKIENIKMWKALNKINEGGYGNYAKKGTAERYSKCMEIAHQCLSDLEHKK